MKNQFSNRFSNKGPLDYGVLALALLIFFGASLHVTYKFDYNWSWSEIPQYIGGYFSTEVLAESAGVIEMNRDGPAVVLVTPAERIDLNISQNQLITPIGSTVMQGEKIGEVSKFRFGILSLGLWMTLKISCAGGIIALILGLLAGLAKASRSLVLYSFANIYIGLVRGTPLLVQLFIIYFMFGTVLGVESRFWCGAVALGLFAGAYSAEIIRSGIESIAKGQMEAARSLGLSHLQAMAYVIMPQVFKRTLPALAGTLISLVKDSSLVSVMALTDLTKAGREIVASSFMVFETWIIVAIMYLALTLSLSYLVSRLERRLALGGQ